MKKRGEINAAAVMKFIQKILMIVFALFGIMLIMKMIPATEHLITINVDEMVIVLAMIAVAYGLFFLTRKSNK